MQVVVPPGGAGAAGRFYSDVIGFTQIDRPQTLRGTGAWFQVGRQQLHVSEYPDFIPSAKAHPAFELNGADLDALAERLTAAGARVDWDQRLPQVRRFYSFDPAGNRIEFLARD